MQVEDILFQQDNAPVQKTYSVIDWFERNWIELVQHLPHCADLNPIKYTWIELKK